MAESISAVNDVNTVAKIDKKEKVQTEEQNKASIMDGVINLSEEEILRFTNYVSKDNKHYIDITSADLSKGEIPSDCKILDKEKIKNIQKEYEMYRGNLSPNSLALEKIIRKRYPNVGLDELSDKQIADLNKEIIDGKYNDLIKQYKAVDFNDKLLIDSKKVTIFSDIADGIYYPGSNNEQKEKWATDIVTTLYDETINKLGNNYSLSDNEKLMYALILKNTSLENLPKTDEEKSDFIKKLVKELTVEEKNLKNEKKLSNRINNITSQAADNLLYDMLAPTFRSIYNSLYEAFEQSTGKQTLFSNMVEAYREQLGSLSSNEKVEAFRSYIADKLTVEDKSVVDKILP